MAFTNWIARLDQGIAGLFGQWNLYSTGLVTLLIGIISYQLYTRQDPEVHPMLLARQAQGTPVRQEGQSPVYRSQSAPHGTPLNSGLNVKDPGASKWARGRDGDLRDIWRQAVGGVKEQGLSQGIVGRLLTVLGTENVTEHNLDDVSHQINLIGQHIVDQGGHRVAIYLPNSVELIATLFACAFYDLTAIILPFDQADDAVITMLRRSEADTVIAAPGAFPFDAVVRSYPALRQLIWVVDEGSKHMDWNEVPQGMGGSVNVSTWHELVSEQPPTAVPKPLPSIEGQKEPPQMTVFWQSKTADVQMVCFTAANIVAAVAGQLHALPTSQRMKPSDLFLPADSLANSHTLVLTLAALYSNASVALNSVAAQAANLSVATAGITPTIIAATPAALLQTHQEARQSGSSFLARQVHAVQTRSLTQEGVMPVASWFTSLADGVRPAIGKHPGKLRLVYAAERAGAGTPPLSSAVLSDLRAYLGARVIYALTAAQVAGAVAQTSFYDYRLFEGKWSHFGPPLTCTEVLLRDSGAQKTTDHERKGEIVVRGPCVPGGEAALGVIGVIRQDNTLAYL